MANPGDATRKRNAAIIRQREAGTSVRALAERYGVSQERVRQIIDLARSRDRETAELRTRFGEHPDIRNLPDDTPIEVMMIMPSKLHGWQVRLHNLRYSELEITTLGGLRAASDRQLKDIPNVGKVFIRELRKYCPERQAPR